MGLKGRKIWNLLEENGIETGEPYIFNLFLLTSGFSWDGF